MAEPNGHADLLTRVEALTEQLDTQLNVEIAPYFAEVIDDWESAIRPFHWAVGFPELFVDAAGESLGEQAGFTIVVGNPPWEIVKPDLREYYAQFDADIESRLTRKKAETRIQQLNAHDPRLAVGWEAQKARIGGDGDLLQKRQPTNSRQGRGDTATHKLFTERAYDLLADTGRLGYVIPSGIYSDLGTKELRQMMLSEGSI